ncbi:MAG TPA: hypothetical protein EYP85_00370 [Armatimonadetes bacterium]|nr:hypothetical protein [Armatimonadota bacterium]
MRITGWLIGILLGCWAVSGKVGASEWPMFNGTVNALGYTTTLVYPPLQLRWRFVASGGFYFTPAVVKGRVYVGCLDYNVYAIDAETGEPLWGYHTNGPVYSGATVVEKVF